MENTRLCYETIGDYDVVIAGGGPAGICAAVSAAQEGMNVIIIEKAGILGGNLTMGHVAPYLGVYGENTLADKINDLVSGEHRVGLCYDTELAKIKLTRFVAESGVKVYLNTSVADVVMENGNIKAVVIATQCGLKCITGKVFIDATGDGVLSFLAGEEIEMGREDGLMQPASVMFTITGVDKEQTLTCEHEQKETIIKRGSYLELCRKACESGELPENVNIVRLYPTVNEGERLVNATQQNGVNGLDPEQYNAAQVALREQMLMVVDFLKNNVEGFENIRIKDSSDIVGIRESRRVMGLYKITAEDLYEGKTYEDTVVHRCYFCIDIHNPAGGGQAEDDAFTHLPQNYDIPYRAMVPKRTANLIVAGRCISGTHRAHASYRVMNICMCMGEAAGAAASVCVKQGKCAAEIDVKNVQQILINRGISLFEKE